jgi:hypothetical protein
MVDCALGLFLCADMGNFAEVSEVHLFHLNSLGEYTN